MSNSFTPRERYELYVDYCARVVPSHRVCSFERWLLLSESQNVRWETKKSFYN